MGNESIKILYNKIGETYRKNRPKTNSDYTETPAILFMVGNVKGKKILDAGCGLGKLSKELIRKGAKVTGVDISEKMIEFSREICAGKGDFFVADFSKFNFKSSSFDLILASYSVHYMEDINLIFERFNKFLKPGGRIIFSVYHPIRFFEKVKKFDYSRDKKYWFDLKGYGVRVFNYYHPLEKYIEALVKNGFEIKRIKEPVVPRRVKGFEESKYRIPSPMIFEAIKK